MFVVATILASVSTLFFGIYEYRREHAFRVDILHSQLQLNNFHVAPFLLTRVGDQNAAPATDYQSFNNKKASPRGEVGGVGIRVTVVDTLGRFVTMYSSEPSAMEKCTTRNFIS